MREKFILAHVIKVCSSPTDKRSTIRPYSKPVLSTPPPQHLRLILILAFHLGLGKSLCIFTCHMHASYLAHLTHIYLVRL